MLTRRSRISELGGVETLVRLCEGSKFDSVHENASAALANLADDQICREKVAK
jgi:hypothetical protein